jgi:hypothetical protein
MGSTLYEVIANGVLPIVLVLFDLVGGLSEVSFVRYLSLLLLLRIFYVTVHALVRPVPLVVGGCGAETWGGAHPARLTVSEERAGRIEQRVGDGVPMFPASPGKASTFERVVLL